MTHSHVALGNEIVGVWLKQETRFSDSSYLLGVAAPAAGGPAAPR